jgi:hypothetical protein
MKVIEKGKSALDESKKREAYDLYKKGIQLLLKGLKGISCIDIYTFYIGITVKPVYKDHSRGPENVVFMSSCPLYTGSNYMHYLLMEKMRLSFIDSDLFYTVAL